MENTLAINNEQVSLIATSSETLKRNQLSVEKATEVGTKLISLIQEKGMNDQIDEQCNNYLVTVNKTIKAMNDRRSPITQLFTQISKHFTTLENELKDGTLVNTIQAKRNEFARVKAEEKRKAEEAAKRKLAVDNEKVELRKTIESKLLDYVTGYTNQVSDNMFNAFNAATLKTIDSTMKTIKEFSSDYPVAHYDKFKSDLTAIYATKEEVEEIVSDVKKSSFQKYARMYWETIDDLKINLESSAPSKRKELESIATMAEEEAENAKKLAKKRAEDEAEKQKQQAAERKKAEEANLNAKAEAGKMDNLFNATEAAVIPESGKSQVRTALKIKVTHQSAWVLIFQYWFENEGIKLGIDEIGKKSLNQMKAFCEKQATKTGEIIESGYLVYEEDFTAVNKA